MICRVVRTASELGENIAEAFFFWLCERLIKQMTWKLVLVINAFFLSSYFTSSNHTEM